MQVLKDDTSLEENNITHENFVVVMIQRVSLLRLWASTFWQSCENCLCEIYYRSVHQARTLRPFLFLKQARKAAPAKKEEQPAVPTTTPAAASAPARSLHCLGIFTLLRTFDRSL